MSKRQEYRQHSKSTLLKATEILFRERETVLSIERRKWRRRLLLAMAAAFLLGGVVVPEVVALLTRAGR